MVPRLAGEPELVRAAVATSPPPFPPPPCPSLWCAAAFVAKPVRAASPTAPPFSAVRRSIPPFDVGVVSWWSVMVVGPICSMASVRPAVRRDVPVATRGTDGPWGRESRVRRPGSAAGRGTMDVPCPAPTVRCAAQCHAAQRRSGATPPCSSVTGHAHRQLSSPQGCECLSLRREYRLFGINIISKFDYRNVTRTYLAKRIIYQLGPSWPRPRKSHRAGWITARLYLAGSVLQVRRDVRAIYRFNGTIVR